MVTGMNTTRTAARGPCPVLAAAAAHAARMAELATMGDGIAAAELPRARRSARDVLLGLVTS